MNDKQKIVTIILALICNFTFLLTAQTRQAPVDGAKNLPECIKSHGADSLETRRNMAYFQENWKKKHYVSAYANWTYVFNNAPCSYKSLYQLGPQLLYFMINNARSESERSKLIDTLFLIFPARIKYFGEEAFVKGSWAYYLSKHQPEKVPEIMGMYNYYFTYQKTRIDGNYVRDYLRNAINAQKNEQFTGEQLCALYKVLRDTARSYETRTMSDTTEYKFYWTRVIADLDQLMTLYPKCSANDFNFQRGGMTEPKTRILLFVNPFKYLKTPDHLQYIKPS